MGNIDDDPNPPDIRPFSRIHEQHNTDTSNRVGVSDHNFGSRYHHHQQHDKHAPITSRTAIATHASLVTRFILIAVALATLPTAAAQHARLNDPYTSPPDDAYATGGAGDGLHHSSKAPILDLVKAGGGWFLSTTASAFGFDLVPAAAPRASGHHIAKRHLDTSHIVEACMIPVLVALSGIFAGLTLGYFSVDQTQLQVLSISGTPKQQEYARKIMPVRKNSHLLLTTLILGNMIVNEALPVITDGVLGGGILAVVISTALVVIFAEIIPQSICSRHGLAIGATMAPVVRVLIWIFFPLGWPIAKLLEYILGQHHGIIYRRAELRELIKMHAATGEGGGDLDNDTITMAQGALDLGTKTVKDAMTPIDDVFMLPIEAKLDYETLGRVVRSGHSRIPVYQMVEVPDIDLTKPTVGPQKTKMVKKIIGSMLVKSCVLLDPEDATPLSSIPINSVPSVPYNDPLTNMLNAFQDGRSHMAIVSRRARKVDDADDVESVMTAAAGGLKEKFMRRVATMSHTHKSTSSDGTVSDTEEDSDVEQGKKKHRFFRRKSSSTTEKSSSPTEPTAADKVKIEAAENEKKRLDRAVRETSKVLDAATLTQNDQGVPADAELPPKSLEQFFDGLEGAPLGIITLEDVLEELIGEEIYDEYDKQGAPRSAASEYVPPEALAAANKAALDRANGTAGAHNGGADGAPTTADAGVGTTPLGPAPSATKRALAAIPKLPKLNIATSLSQPGRSRSEVATVTPAAPLKRASSPVPTLKNEDIEAANQQQQAPQPIVTTPLVGTPTTEKHVTLEAPTQQPVTAIPTRLQPEASANRLAEAVRIERERRRLAAAGSAPPGLLRAASSTGIPRTQSSVPPRVGTPPTPGVVEGASMTGPTTSTGAASSGRRTPKFKSTPLALTASMPHKSAAAAAASASTSAPPTAKPTILPEVSIGAAEVTPVADISESTPKDDKM